mmetsp:Transcript_34249/g.98629  ORF Transcript_34249/g.98629 Transcript_34249/m.98629 type:complete len:190 (-) Transcript_34249:1571-2140(-)
MGMNASSSTASLAAIAACGVAIRALLFFHSSASASGSAIFFGLNTFDSLKETAFARKHGGVASAVIGSSPRVLLALERFSEHTGGVVDTREGEREMTFWVLTAVDVCIAVCLWISARAHQKGVPYLGPSFVAASYLLNPLTVCTSYTDRQSTGGCMHTCVSVCVCVGAVNTGAFIPGLYAMCVLDDARH